MVSVRPPDTDFLKSLVRVRRRGAARWMDKRGERYYTWDSLHGEFEVFNKRGAHLGAMDPNGNFTKGPVKGRRIDV